MFRSFDPDGLNQLATVNGAAASYDSNGNMTADPVTAKAYLYYSSNNLLRNTPSPWTSLDYDAFDRLLYTEYPTTYYVFDGNDQIAQYDAGNVLQKRYAFDGTGWRRARQHRRPRQRHQRDDGHQHLRRIRNPWGH
jgi:hypothetical protein